ncbi:MAG: type pullulanase [Bacteroidota bacterium]|jgi:pullulanase
MRYLFLLTLTMTFSRLMQGQEATEKIGDLTFDNYPVYEGNDLGATYHKRRTEFKLWSPPAAEAMLQLYRNGSGGEPERTLPMRKGKNGVWQIAVKGDLAGQYYTYRIRMGAHWLPETSDPYGKAVGVNGTRSMVIDLSTTDPPGWGQDQRPPLAGFEDIILYELHLRDISVHPAGNIPHPGKYLGLAAEGTRTEEGLPSGLDHIQSLGVTHVHVLPFYDFLSIDESLSDESSYNWGYDPQNYNAPEGSYSTDATDGRVRIRELKQMVQSLHRKGLRVVMDVVYNHTGGPVESHSLYLTVPNYYYRIGPPPRYKWSNGSACGNELASEREMVRRYIVQSITYWAREYHIDGFRVDLMGLLDIETMNAISAALREIDPTIFVYGEGWTANETVLYEQDRSIKSNANRLDGIAVFCDEFRDGVKGHVFKPTEKGFVNGRYGMEESVKFGIVGACPHPQVDYQAVNYAKAPWARSPAGCINYVSCHDNHTLWDRLRLSCPENTEEDLLAMNKLAQTMVLTSQGIPFLHGGEEIVRTKMGVENSFESPDQVNWIDWSHKERYSDLFQYYQALIRLRKEHPAFRMKTGDDIARHLQFFQQPFDNVVSYELDGAAVGDPWKRIFLVFNGNKVGKQVTVPEGDWRIVCQNRRIDPAGMGKLIGNKSFVHPWSALILASWE